MTEEKDSSLGQSGETSGTSVETKSQQHPVVRILILLIVCAVGGIVTWEALAEWNFRSTLSCMQKELDKVPVGEKGRLNLQSLDTTECIVGDPERNYIPWELGELQAVSFVWPGLLMSHGPMHVIYLQEDPFLQVIEIQTGPAKE